MKATKLPEGFDLVYSYSPHVEGADRTERFKVVNGKLVMVLTEYWEDKVTEISGGVLARLYLEDFQKYVTGKQKDIDDLEKEIIQSKNRRDELIAVVDHLKGMIAEESSTEVWKCG